MAGNSNILTLTHDTHKAIVWLTDIQKKQIPFATSLALNKTGQAIDAAMAANSAKKFILRNTWTEKGWQMNPSNKRNLNMEVGSVRQYMERQEEGGTFTANGKSFALPKAVRPDVSKIVRRTKFPSKLLAKKGYFIKRTRYGTAALFKANKDKSLTMMFALERQIKIKPNLDFDKTANALAIKLYPIEFDRAFEMALATARY